MTGDPNNCEGRTTQTKERPQVSQLKVSISTAMKVIAAMAGFAVAAIFISSSQVAGQGRTPVGAWEVQHGPLHIVYAFANDGTYTYQRYGTGREEEETGVYAVQGDRLIVKPESGPQRVFRWRIGPDPATAGYGGQVLFLRYQDDREEFFYPQ